MPGADEERAALLLEPTSVATLASLSWRTLRLAARILDKAPEDEKRRLASQLLFLDRQIENELCALGMKVVDLKGQVFADGTAASALNASDFAPDEPVRVVRTLEPIVLGSDGVLRTGVVLLGRDGE